MKFAKKKTTKFHLYPEQKITSETLLIHLASRTIEERERDERDCMELKGPPLDRMYAHGPSFVPYRLF
jgi:hypothetical protein